MPSVPRVPATWRSESEHRRLLANAVNIALDSPAFVAIDVPQTIANGTASVEVDLLADYDYKLSMWEVMPVTDSVAMLLEFYEAGAYVTSGYSSEAGPITTTPSSVSSTTNIRLGGGAGNAAGEGWRRMEIIILNGNNATYQSMAQGHSYRLNATGQSLIDSAFGHRTTAVAATKFKVYPTSGNFASGYYQVESRPVKRVR